jgi:hypothetical protein
MTRGVRCTAPQFTTRSKNFGERPEFALTPALASQLPSEREWNCCASHHPPRASMPKSVQIVGYLRQHVKILTGYGGRDLVGRRSHSRSLENLRHDQRVDADQTSVQTMYLREVLADQSDRGHRANVQKIV